MFFFFYFARVTKVIQKCIFRQNSRVRTPLDDEFPKIFSYLTAFFIYVEYPLF